MRFSIGRHYTREQIHDAVGGGLTEALPHRDGRVVAACLDPRINPGAPELVAVGNSPNAQRWAGVFAEQREPVPIFLKDGVQRWRYVGDFRVVGQTADPEELRAHVVKGAEPPAALLQLEPASRVARRVGSLGAWLAVALVGGAAGAGAGLLVERTSRGAAFGAGFGVASGLAFRKLWRGKLLPPREAARSR